MVQVDTSMKRNSYELVKVCKIEMNGFPIEVGWNILPYHSKETSQIIPNIAEIKYADKMIDISTQLTLPQMEYGQRC